MSIGHQTLKQVDAPVIITAFTQVFVLASIKVSDLPIIQSLREIFFKKDDFII